MKLKMHAKRELRYDPETTGVVWCLCLRNVEQNQIAAFETGVTCKKCLAAISWRKENEKPNRMNGVNL